LKQVEDSLGLASPLVLKSTDKKGIYWLSLQGFDHLYPKLNSWAQRLIEMLDLPVSVVISFGKFQSYALLRYMMTEQKILMGQRIKSKQQSTTNRQRAKFNIQHYSSEEDAKADFDRISLIDTDLGVDLKESDYSRLALFKIKSVAQLAALPEDELQANLSKQMFHLYRLIVQKSELPSVVLKDRQVLFHHFDLEYAAEPSAQLILSLTTPYLARVIDLLKYKFCCIQKIEISFTQDLQQCSIARLKQEDHRNDGPKKNDRAKIIGNQDGCKFKDIVRVNLSEPTHDLSMIRELLRIKLTSGLFVSDIPVTDMNGHHRIDCSRIYISIHYTEIRQADGRLFKDRVCSIHPGYNGSKKSHNTGNSIEVLGEQCISAANQALDYLRNKYGSTSVVTAKTRDSYFPEDRFSWLPAENIKKSLLKEAAQFSAIPLGTHSSKNESNQIGNQTSKAQLVRRFRDNLPLESEPVGDALGGPFRLSIQQSGEATRDYYYMRTPMGTWKWIYFDHGVHEWRLQGTVE